MFSFVSSKQNATHFDQWFHHDKDSTERQNKIMKWKPEVQEIQKKIKYFEPQNQTTSRIFQGIPIQSLNTLQPFVFAPDISVKNAQTAPVTFTFDISFPKPFTKSFLIPSLNSLGSFVSEFCSRQTDNQTGGPKCPTHADFGR